MSVNAWVFSTLQRQSRKKRRVEHAGGMGGTDETVTCNLLLMFAKILSLRWASNDAKVHWLRPQAYMKSHLYALE
jgi:hypothetical protein